jgi:hypothetical protein
MYSNKKKKMKYSKGGAVTLQQELAMGGSSKSPSKSKMKKAKPSSSGCNRLY